MITLKPYSKESKSIWNEFNQNAKNGLFMFDRDYMDYHAHRFADNSLMFYEDEELLALLPLNLKDNILYSHQGLTFGGFITGEKMKQEKMLECFKLLREYMQNRGFDKMIYKVIPYIYHKKPAQEDLYALFIHNAKLYRMDCSSSIDMKFPIALPKGRKAQISRAKRENIIIEKSENFYDFVLLLNEVLQTRHHTTAVHNAQELMLLYQNFPHNINLFVARLDSNILAGTLIFIYENLVHTQYLAVNEEGRKIGALDLLIKTLIDKFSNTKKYFDFGISTESNGTILNSGLISQKEGFGGRTITHSFYELIINGGGHREKLISIFFFRLTFFFFLYLLNFFYYQSGKSSHLILCK